MFLELWKILGEKVSPNFTTTFSIVKQYGRRLKFQDFLSKYESKSRHDSNERQSHPPSYPPVPESEFDEPNAGRGLFRNEDKIAKRPSCGETIQRTIFLYSVSNAIPEESRQLSRRQLDERLSGNWQDESRRRGTSHFTTTSNFELRF